MAAITTLRISGIDPETYARLRLEATRHGRSVEAEARAILHARLAQGRSEGGLGTSIHERFASLGGGLALLGRSSEPPRAAPFEP